MELNKFFNKRGMSTTVIISIVLLIIAMAAIFIMYSLVFGNGDGSFDSKQEICHASVLVRSAPGAQNIQPLRCQTEDVCIVNYKLLNGLLMQGSGKCSSFGDKKDVVTVKLDGDAAGEAGKELRKNQTKQAIADKMLRCWNMMGEGNLNFMGGEMFNKNYCVLCSRISFDKAVMDEFKTLTPEETSALVTWDFRDNELIRNPVRPYQLLVDPSTGVIWYYFTGSKFAVAQVKNKAIDFSIMDTKMSYLTSVIRADHLMLLSMDKQELSDLKNYDTFDISGFTTTFDYKISGVGEILKASDDTKTGLFIQGGDFGENKIGRIYLRESSGGKELDVAYVNNDYKIILNTDNILQIKSQNPDGSGPLLNFYTGVTNAELVKSYLNDLNGKCVNFNEGIIAKDCEKTTSNVKLDSPLSYLSPGKDTTGNPNVVFSICYTSVGGYKRCPYYYKWDSGVWFYSNDDQKSWIKSSASAGQVPSSRMDYNDLQTVSKLVTEKDGKRIETSYADGVSIIRNRVLNEQSNVDIFLKVVYSNNPTGEFMTKDQVSKLDSISLLTKVQSSFQTFQELNGITDFEKFLAQTKPEGRDQTYSEIFLNGGDQKINSQITNNQLQIIVNDLKKNGQIGDGSGVTDNILGQRRTTLPVEKDYLVVYFVKKDGKWAQYIGPVVVGAVAVTVGVVAIVAAIPSGGGSVAVAIGVIAGVVKAVTVATPFVLISGGWTSYVYLKKSGDSYYGVMLKPDTADAMQDLDCQWMSYD